MVVYVSSIVVLLFQGWGLIENDNPIVSDGSVRKPYGMPIIPRVGLGARARCEYGEKPRYKGRPRCDILGNGCRPRCELWAINRVHLDLAFVG